MPKPYSMDFRQRVVDMHRRNGWTQDETAEHFGLGVATVYRWLATLRDKGTLEPLPHGGGPAPAVTVRTELALRALVEEKPDRTLRELGQILGQRFKRRFTPPTLCRALKRMGLTLKKSRSSRASATGRTSSRSVRPSSARCVASRSPG